MLKPYYDHGGITIYHADCREIIEGINFDAIITDPPYGVFLGEVGTGQEILKKQTGYSLFQDSVDYLRGVCIPALTDALRKSKRGAVFCGNRNLWLYPPAEEVGCWFVPAATSRGKWGFNCANLILYYGKDPMAGLGSTANSKMLQISSDNVDHPCPKPMKIVSWLVSKASAIQDIILDPFMGSGTTLRAAKDLGRKAIGIEIEEKYCEIAAKRLQQEVFNFGEAV